MKTPRKIRQFFDFPSAFNYCREMNSPVSVLVEDHIYNLFPSGYCEIQISCECGNLDKHMDCPVHGVYEWSHERGA